MSTSASKSKTAVAVPSDTHLTRSGGSPPAPQASSPAVSITVQPIALNLTDAARGIGVPSWTLRESVMLGKLRAKKAGRAHIVLLSDLQRWAESLDDVEPSTAPSLIARQAARNGGAA